jgi:glutaredoxin
MQKKVLLLTLLFTATTTLAQSVYSWKDENGVTHFGDTPRSPRATVIDLGEINASSTDAHMEKTPEAGTPPPVAKHKQPGIVMYSAAWCGVCKKAKGYFAKNKVQYTEYDVETSTTGKAFYAKRTKKSVPIFLVDGKERSGFSTGSFNKLLGLK